MNKRCTLLSIVAFIGLALFIAWLAPAEQTLGNAVKLIYVHTALVFVSMILVTCVGLLGLLYLVTGKDLFLKLSGPTKETALVFWTVYLATSFVAMGLTWGGIVWTEPRLLLGVSIFLILIAIYLLSRTFSAPKLISVFNILMGAAVWVLILRIPAVMHPTTNPILNSPSLAIRLSTLGIFLLFLASAIQLIRYLRR